MNAPSLQPSLGLYALRLGVALCETEHVVCLRLAGEHAFDGFDAVCPAELYLRDGQLMQTLLLDDEARPIADVMVACDDEELILFVEGMSRSELTDWLRQRMPTPQPELVDLEERYALLSLAGPYAWELVAELVGPEIIGASYLSMFDATSSGAREQALGFRAGKTGEYGYDLLIPHEDLALVRARLDELAPRFALAHATLADLEQCALENFFFNVRREGAVPGVTPLELQLQWRVSRVKPGYVGAEALARRLASDLRERLTMVSSSTPLSSGSRLLRGDLDVGAVVAAGYSPWRSEHVGLALLALRSAWPDLELFDAECGATVRTISAPALQNRSLFVSVEQHRFATRDQDEFPPLVAA